MSLKGRLALLSSILFTAIAVISWAFAWIGHKDFGTSMNTAPLRVAIPVAFQPLSSLDPAKISYSDEYATLRNLCSPLVEMDSNGQIVSGLAKTFELESNALILTLREDIQTIDGQLVDAEDVKMTLDRLLRAKTVTHGSLHTILCGAESGCDAIEILGSHKLKLNIKKGSHFLLPMLTSMDFVILTKSQVDQDGEIKDFRNTSGPYYVESSDLESGVMTLRVNLKHYNFHEKMPQIVKLMPSKVGKVKNSRSVFERFESNDLDYVPAYAHQDKAKYVDSANKTGANIRQSHNLGRLLLVYTQKGMETLSSADRFAIGKAVRQKIWDDSKEKLVGRKQTWQYFGDATVENLTSEDLEKIKLTFDRAPVSKKAIKISTYPGIKTQFENIDFSKTSVTVSSDVLDHDLNQQEGFAENYPDAYIVSTDSTWLENISFLTYAFKRGHFLTTPEMADQFLESYMIESDRTKRIEKLRELHFNTLMSPKMVPIFSEPYFSILRNPWIEEQNPMSPSGALWRIRRNS